MGHDAENVPKRVLWRKNSGFLQRRLTLGLGHTFGHTLTLLLRSLGGAHLLTNLHVLCGHPQNTRVTLRSKCPSFPFFGFSGHFVLPKGDCYRADDGEDVAVRSGEFANGLLLVFWVHVAHALYHNRRGSFSTKIVRAPLCILTRAEPQQVAPMKRFSKKLEVLRRKLSESYCCVIIERESTPRLTFNLFQGVFFCGAHATGPYPWMRLSRVSAPMRQAHLPP